MESKNDSSDLNMLNPYTINITFCGEPDKTFNLECQILESAIEECKLLLSTLVLFAWDNDLWGEN